jgi:SprT protein
MSHLYELLVKKNKDYIDLANQIYKLDLPYPEIKCTLKGKVAGYAYCKKWKVNYNGHFLKNHTDHFLVQTVGHEIAHLVAYKLFKSHRHDSRWQSVMYKFDLDPTRCHDYDCTTLPKYVDNAYVYTCGCMDHTITQRIHTKIIQGNNRTCNTCKQVLVLKSSPKLNQSITTPIIIPTPVVGISTKPSGIYLQQIRKNVQEVEAASVLVNQGKKITNKSIVAEIMVKYGASKTDAEIAIILQYKLNISLQNAKVYLYNYRKNLKKNKN